MHKHTPEIPAMWQVRPDWLTKKIDDKFAFASGAIPEGYGLHGTDPNYVVATSTIHELADRQRARLERPLRILEVGCAAGYLITQGDWGNDVVHGLTAYDYRKAPQFPFTPPEDSYFIGNAEYLDQLEGLLPKYDIVLSLMTLQHLIDKVGTIEQMADRVASNGLLCLDRFEPYDDFAPYDSDQALKAPQLEEILRRSGFNRADLGPRSAGQQLAARVGQVVLERDDSEQPVRFGIDYAYIPIKPGEHWVPTWQYVVPGKS